MNKHFTVAAAGLALGVAVGCSHDRDAAPGPNTRGPSMSGSSTGGGKPLEGNPGATTNQASGYPQSDPGAYHPQTDDTKQYHPAPPSAVQPANAP